MAIKNDEYRLLCIDAPLTLAILRYLRIIRIKVSIEFKDGRCASISVD
jgi:hypothetical protein